MGYSTAWLRTGVPFICDFLLSAANAAPAAPWSRSAALGPGVRPPGTCARTDTTRRGVCSSGCVRSPKYGPPSPPILATYGTSLSLTTSRVFWEGLRSKLFTTSRDLGPRRVASCAGDMGRCYACILAGHEHCFRTDMWKYAGKLLVF